MAFIVKQRSGKENFYNNHEIEDARGSELVVF